MDKSKEFEMLIKNLSLAYYQFCLNEIMHEKVAGKIFTDFQLLWTVTLLGLEEAYLLGLAKFFDRPKELDETISIYYFFDFNQNELINKLKMIRNKMIVHLDKKLALKTGFLDELRLTKGDIESLFVTAITAVDQIKKNFGVIEDLKLEFELKKAETRHWFNEWFDVFKKEIPHSETEVIS